jgi:GT2 family glycosyltransferase
VPRRDAQLPSTPAVRTAPVLAVLVCHDGEQWLPAALAALRRLTPRPRHVIAVDTGSVDDTPRLLAAAAKEDDRVLDGVLTEDRDTGFGAAVRAAVDHAVERWGDPGGWVWLLHDDCAPEPGCLGALLRAAEISPSVGVLGPLALDWDDPRLVVGAGLATDASGHRQTGLGPNELDWGRVGDRGQVEQTTEVLAVSSAGMLVRRKLWERLGGFDSSLPLLWDDIDFGWRANQAGRVVLCVPAARLRHARALHHGTRSPDALGVPGDPPDTPEVYPEVRVAERAHGLRTFLVNTSTVSFLLGVPRLSVLCVLRALGFLLLRRGAEAGTELISVGRLWGMLGDIRRARVRVRANAGSGTARGLLTSRFTRLRNGIRGWTAQVVRRRVAADAALGRLPSGVQRVDPEWPEFEPDEEEFRPQAGPAALPTGALGRTGLRRDTGLRRPPTTVAVAVQETEPTGTRPSPRPRPSPHPRGAPAPAPDLFVVHVDRGRVLREVLFAPPVLLLAGLLALGLAMNAGRFGLDLAGGRLLPVGGLGETWGRYLSAWHPVDLGTAAQAPAALAVLGTLGAVLAPLGGVSAAVALLLFADLPLAGLSAYLATRRLPVRRWVRALIAAGYALLPPATAAVAQGRLDVVVVHILLPPVFAGLLAVVVRGSRSWLPITATTALILAVIGAFSPLVHVMVLVCALGGFVLVPGQTAGTSEVPSGRRRAGALFMIVLLPLALLLPWPVAVLENPGLVLHGVGGYLPEQAVSVLELLSLDPGGAGAWPVLGLLVPVAAIGALVVRPSRTALPGIGLVLLGAAAVAVLLTVPVVPAGGGSPQHGWTGAALLVVGWGLLLVFAAGCAPVGKRAAPSTVRGYRVLVGLVAAAVLALAVGAAVPGRSGPLRADGGVRLATTLAEELAATGRAVLVLAHEGQPVRSRGGRMPAFGDDDLAQVPSAASQLDRLDATLRSSAADVVRGAVTSAAAAGVLFVVLPDTATEARLTALAGDLVADAPATSDGRPVLRLSPVAGQAVLLAPEAAKQAVTGGSPPADLAPGAVVPVAAGPPEANLRVSDGSDGRVLVLAATQEAGWQASVAGRQVPVVRVWGNLVGVAVPPRASDVRVEYDSTLRDWLLLVQAATLLFTLLTAIPGRRAVRPNAIS